VVVPCGIRVEFEVLLSDQVDAIWKLGGGSCRLLVVEAEVVGRNLLGKLPKILPVFFKTTQTELVASNFCLLLLAKGVVIGPIVVILQILSLGLA